jgi:hypothetical protein
MVMMEGLIMCGCSGEWLAAGENIYGGLFAVLISIQSIQQHLQVFKPHTSNPLQIPNITSSSLEVTNKNPKWSHTQSQAPTAASAYVPPLSIFPYHFYFEIY